MTQFDANQWIQDNLDEEGYDAPNTDLRRILTTIMLDRYIQVREVQDPSYHSNRSISEEIAQAIAEWDKRYFTFEIGTESAMLRYNGKRCKYHGNEGFGVDEHKRVIHGEPCQLCTK